ncbi:hypothetical protein MN116_001126 [Schistosoma mekongi]|uniref:Asparagine synthetase domain-containing protein n=1 Tax=Schistosoma mekongi TaxID=38744 RepID=A0AAE1ZLY7_SCHME|nr:hypothetical protein MN116_001126 [Schistosoma mekongi]
MLNFSLFVSVTPNSPEVYTQVEDSNSLQFQSILDANSIFYHTLGRSCWKIAKVPGGCITIIYSSSVFSDQLSLDSHQFLVQSNPGCDILFWSGQIYSSSEITIARKIESENPNVGQVLLDAFSKEKEVAGVVNLINSLIGSFILIFVNIESNRIYFTRDRCGRHSVVARRFTKVPDDSLCIDSISSMVIQTRPSVPEVTLELLERNAKDWFEIPACGIFVSKVVCDNENVFLSDVNLYPWSEQHLPLCPSSLSVFVNRVLSKHQNHCSRVLPNVYTSITFKEAQHKLLELLLAVVSDSVNYDLLFDLNYSFNLFNVAGNNWSGSLFGLLFSGGLDSSVIAVILDRFVPKNQSIDLINVGFQRKRSDTSVSSSTCLDSINLISAEEAPDRITALKSYEELCRLSPQRKWNLIKVNVSVSEIQEARIKHVWPLLLPGHTTVLDDSLGLALWFAARGEGVLHTSSDLEAKCISSVKFLFLGSGIDEQLAGYSRHLTIYKKFGAEALQRELSKEILYISSRNLGRDDRLISAHGRMARLPYLDDRIIEFLAKVPVEFKINPDLPKGQGEKLLLRQVALMLNLNYASKQPKRAMQFGSRVAKAEGSKHFTGSADQTKFTYQSETQN